MKTTRDKKTIKDEEKHILSKQNLKAAYISKTLITLWYEMPSLQDPFVIYHINISVEQNCCTSGDMTSYHLSSFHHLRSTH